MSRARRDRHDVRRAAAAALACGLLAAGCSSGDPAQGPAGSVATTPSAATAAAAGSAIHYVALGDSYSAGPLIPVQRLDPLGCGRSTNDYPAYLADWLDVASYRDVTCSGARSVDVTEPQRVAVGGVVVPPQADALVSGTSLVTVGLGGNDGGLFGHLAAGCLQIARAGGGAPCRRHFDTAGGNSVERAARDVRTSLGAALTAVREAAPGARVFAVGYPQIVPASGTCAAVPFAAGDYRWVRRVERLLNRSVARAASVAGATYVDVWTPSRGHDACAGDAAWIRGTQDVAGAAVLHPFRRGEQAIARVVYRAVTGRRAPRDASGGAGATAAPAPSAVVTNGT